MFGIGTQEILLILVVVLLLFGGKRLPEIARTLGKGVGDFKRAVRDVQSDFDLESLGQDSPPAATRGVKRKPVSETPEGPPSQISMKATGPPPAPKSKMDSVAGADTLADTKAEKANSTDSPS
jgi:TatA/E family protein of Tat protein translocase